MCLTVCQTLEALGRGMNKNSEIKSLHTNVRTYVLAILFFSENFMETYVRLKMICSVTCIYLYLKTHLKNIKFDLPYNTGTIKLYVPDIYHYFQSYHQSYYQFIRYEYPVQYQVQYRTYGFDLNFFLGLYLFVCIVW